MDNEWNVTTNFNVDLNVNFNFNLLPFIIKFFIKNHNFIKPLHCAQNTRYIFPFVDL